MEESVFKENFKQERLHLAAVSAKKFHVTEHVKNHYKSEGLKCGLDVKMNQFI
jgi:hypothetical protein